MSGRRFVSTMLEKNNFLSRSILSCPLSSNNVLLAVLVSTVDSSCLTNCMSSLRVGWSFPFSSHQPTLLSRRYLIPYTIQVYAIVPFFAVFKVWILIAVCRRFSCVSFSDFIRIDIQNWTTHIFVHINSCSGYQVSPHLAPPPLPISPRLQLFAMLSIDPPLPYIGLNHKAPLCCWCFWQLLEIWHSHALSCLCFQLCLFTCRI